MYKTNYSSSIFGFPNFLNLKQFIYNTYFNFLRDFSLSRSKRSKKEKHQNLTHLSFKGIREGARIRINLVEAQFRNDNIHLGKEIYLEE